MFYTIEAQLPSGTRIRLEKAGGKWVATLASHQFCFSGGDVESFDSRARDWLVSNLRGESLAASFVVVSHFAQIVRDIESQKSVPLIPPRETRGGS